MTLLEGERAEVSATFANQVNGDRTTTDKTATKLQPSPDNPHSTSIPTSSLPVSEPGPRLATSSEKPEAVSTFTNGFHAAADARQANGDSTAEPPKAPMPQSTNKIIDAVSPALDSHSPSSNLMQPSQQPTSDIRLEAVNSTIPSPPETQSGISDSFAQSSQAPQISTDSSLTKSTAVVKQSPSDPVTLPMNDSPIPTKQPPSAPTDSIVGTDNILAIPQNTTSTPSLPFSESTSAGPNITTQDIKEPDTNTPDQVLSTTETQSTPQVSSNMLDAPASESTPAPMHASSRDTVMEDVSNSPRGPSPKISRSRDDDDVDSPIAKRPRTEDDRESADSKPTQALETTKPVSDTVSLQGGTPHAGSNGSIVSGISTQAPVPTTSVPSQSDTPMTRPQQRHIQRVLSNLKRIASSRPFIAPVDYITLKIPNYPDVIKEPMDLKTLEDNLRADVYSTVGAVVSRVDLIVSNSQKFNGPEHPVTKNAVAMRASFSKYMESLPSVDVKDSAPSKKKAVDPMAIRPPPARRESRVSIPATAISPISATSPGQSFALGPDGIPLIRRDSALDGRPKREIHRPPPRDLPYNSQKPKKKKFQMELRFCDQVLKEISKPKYAQNSFPFMNPVDPVALNIPTYLSVVKKPMDFGTMRQKLDRGEYENAKEFEGDARQVFKNCYLFNPEGEAVNVMGRRFEQVFSDEWSKKREWLEDNTPSSGQRSANESDNDESDESDEDDEEADEPDQQTEIVARLQKQIAEMSKQVELITNPKKKSPPTSASSKRMSAGAKDGKSGKAGKKDGGKRDGKSGNRKTGKSGISGASRGQKVPYITYEQKRDISNRINSLSASRMTQALTIIRNSMPNLHGVHEDELELDIDELSDDVLFKLLQFVRKHVPRPDDSPLRTGGGGGSGPVAARKKNKPMSKSEQEARIAQVQSGLSAFQRGGGAASPSHRVHQSIEEGDVDSEDEDDDDDGSESEEE